MIQREKKVPSITLTTNFLVGMLRNVAVCVLVRKIVRKFTSITLTTIFFILTLLFFVYSLGYTKYVYGLTPSGVKFY